MRRLKYTLGGFAALAAIWFMSWHAGRMLWAEPEADRAVEDLHDGQLFFSYDRRRIGGFPFSYDIVFEEAELSDETGLWRWRAPSVGIGSALIDAGALTVRPAAQSRLIVESALWGGTEGAPPAVFEIGVEGLTAALADGALSIDADAVEAVQKGAAALIAGGRLGFTAFKAEISRNGTSAYSGAVDAESAELAYRLGSGDLFEKRSRMSLNGLSAEIEFEPKGTKNLVDFIRADGRAYLSASARKYTTVDVSAGPNDLSMEMRGAAKNLTVDLSIARGRANYASAAEDIGMTFEGSVPFPLNAFTIAQGEAHMEMPLRQDAGAPYRLSLAVREFSPDATVWNLWDPEATLPRDPATLIVDLTGSALVLTDFSGTAPPGAPPIELETLSIDALTLSAFGVEAHAKGAFDIAGDASQPDGAVTVRLKGGLALVDKLTATGVLTQNAAAHYAAMAERYAVKGDGPDELIAEIVSKDGVVVMNGVPLTEQ